MVPHLMEAIHCGNLCAVINHRQPNLASPPLIDPRPCEWITLLNPVAVESLSGDHIRALPQQTRCHQQNIGPVEEAMCRLPSGIESPVANHLANPDVHAHGGRQ